ncbi:TetR/AcrR family transcriptional regulator [Blastococcus sp. URHD0036]|uniref:TetR/AcrR family transcriptional regulator n=1 Tax=Blastococcus sp. URHD0036 TaxID=1380356 RepID=UPI00068C50AD|nr:TetR/AcrR family transcriptional regulator [Blastococcus sp. URHD0036]
MDDGLKNDASVPATLGGVEVKQQRSVLSTLAMLDAAAELVVEVGYERATLAAIAQRAGYSHGLVTQRFGSKESLLIALIERMTTAADGAAGPEAPHGMAAALGAYDTVLNGWRRSPLSMRALYVLMLTSIVAQPALRDRMVQLHRDFRARMASEIRHAVDSGELAPAIDADEIAASVLTSLRGCAYQWVLDPEGFSFESALTAERRAMQQRLDPFLLRSSPTTGDRDI